MGCTSSADRGVKSQESPASMAPTVQVEVTPAASSPKSAVAVPDDKLKNDINSHAVFGAGCYWGTEKYLFYDFQKKMKEKGKLGRIISGQVGFMGPASAPSNPSYKDVCSGATGHVEVYHCEFEGGSEFYEAMVRYFFQFHDPTTFNKQGNDKGTQYASVIYCFDQKQIDIATKVRADLQQLIDEKKVTAFAEKRVNTDIRSATTFFPAHAEHQDYLANNPNGYCNHRVRFAEWPSV